MIDLTINHSCCIELLNPFDTKCSFDVHKRRCCSKRQQQQQQQKRNGAIIYLFFINYTTAKGKKKMSGRKSITENRCIYWFKMPIQNELNL